MTSQRRQSTSQATARRWKSRLQRFLLACFFLQFIIVGIGLYYTDNLNFIFPKRNTALHGVTLEKNNPVQKKDAVITLKNVNTTVDVAEKSEKESHEQERQDSTITDSKNQQQTIPVISKDDASATAAIKQETSGQYYYTVQAGDNLGIISKKVYGTSTSWRVIANANTDQLGNNPNRLHLGMTLTIPALTKTGDILLQPDSSTSLQKIE